MPQPVIPAPQGEWNPATGRLERFPRLRSAAAMVEMCSRKGRLLTLFPPRVQTVGGRR